MKKIRERGKNETAYKFVYLLTIQRIRKLPSPQYLYEREGVCDVIAMRLGLASPPLPSRRWKRYRRRPYLFLHCSLHPLITWNLKYCIIRFAKKRGKNISFKYAPFFSGLVSSNFIFQKSDFFSLVLSPVTK